MAEVLNEEDSDYETNRLSDIRKQLIDLAKETMESEKEHENIGLSRAEMAFYNAVANSENIQDFYTDEQLIKLTKELTETISNEMTQDWAVKESGRANVRRTIKRLLKKYKYPGNFKETIQLVVKQAEHWDVIKDSKIS
ncbi:type I restriction enzyme endonuclease domain-containing protein [Facklamia sp. P9177]|uniref:type I restriction enzyme endonuclease domain-containing protein n=1 Tax=Facklamia sp. P9177 TaxID=3421945 RepID=UPI003D1713FC